jgi:transcriptional regulator with XRE-family HTH domain
MCYLTGNGGIFEMISGRFKDRLKIAIGERSVNSFAKECEAAEGAIRNYLKGQTTPNLDMLTKISEVSGYSLAWLASGEGEMVRGEGAETPVNTGPALDFDLLEKIIIDRMVFQQLAKGGTEAVDEAGKVDEVHYLVAEMFGRHTASMIIDTYKTCIGRPSIPPDKIIKNFNSMVSHYTNKLNEIADKREALNRG